MDGEYRGYPVLLFDYHYRTKGDWFWAPSWRKPNYVCVALVDLEKHFPELIIGPEGGGLLANKGLSIEVDQTVLALGSKGMHNVNRIESRLQKLAEIRERMPNYLFEGAHG